MGVKLLILLRRTRGLSVHPWECAYTDVRMRLHWWCENALTLMLSSLWVRATSKSFWDVSNDLICSVSSACDLLHSSICCCNWKSKHINPYLQVRNGRERTVWDSGRKSGPPLLGFQLKKGGEWFQPSELRKEHQCGKGGWPKCSSIQKTIASSP